MTTDDFENVSGETLTEEETICEEHYKNTFYCDEDGRLMVKMPFKNEMEKPDLGIRYHEQSVWMRAARAEFDEHNLTVWVTGEEELHIAEAITAASK